MSGAAFEVPDALCAFCLEPYSEHTTAEMESCWADLEAEERRRGI